MQSTPAVTRVRLRFLCDRMKANIYPDVRPVKKIAISQQTDRIGFQAAQELEYTKVKLGQQLGPLWATYWFKASTVVPPEWAGRRVDLIWNSGSEATLYMHGRSLQGLNYGGETGRFEAMLTPAARAGEKLDFQVEMACNNMFGVCENHPYKNVSPFVFDRCDIAVFDPVAWELYHDFLFLLDLEQEFANEGGISDKPFQGELLFKLNEFANVYEPADRQTWPAAQSMLKELYTRRNGSNMHELSAIGHAHIDTGWLWPLAETWRKLVRTLSTAVGNMDQYPDYKMAVSAAYHYKVIKEQNPDLYERMKAKIDSGQLIPVGGTWVEPDCNIPSGENLARQFLYGQRFFIQEFGVRAREFWNPDVFGYNSQLPQIMRLAGVDRFLTQKLSWNAYNKPRFSTFYWEGLDGSRVLTHFPPADTYNAKVSVDELRRNIREHKEHGRSNHSLLLFGWGDGGGGPTRQHIEFARRSADLQGLPRTTMRSPREFFDLLERDSVDLPKLIGELYFEMHRGTYTSQGWIKHKMRRAEVALHNAEFLWTLAAKLHGAKYPHERLHELWELVLINDFHDILPGSSIALVNEVAWEHLDQAIAGARELTGAAAAILLPAESKAKASKSSGGKRSRSEKNKGSGLTELTYTPINTAGFSRREVAQRPDGELVVVAAPSYGIGQVEQLSDNAVTAKVEGQTVVLENAYLRAVLHANGTVLSLVHKASGRESLVAPGNRLQLHEERPASVYDAWDCEPHHLEHLADCPDASSYELVVAPLRVEVCFQRDIGQSSSARQTVRLDADSPRLEFHTVVDWQESNQFLKAMFPVDVRSMTATYEMQFGATARPTHQNTTADLAQWEVPGHKWADLSEHGFGVAILSDSKYGYSTLGQEMRISLLRSPKYPDDQADMMEHSFAYAIYPHAGGWQDGGVVAQGYSFNQPFVWAGAAAVEPSSSFVAVDNENLVVDTVKVAEDSDGVVVRLYEAHGARGQARLRVGVPFSKAVLCNILEDDGETLAIQDDGRVLFDFRPAQIISIKLS